MRKQILSILVSLIIFSLGIAAFGNPTNLFDNIFKKSSISDNIFTNQTNNDKTVYYILFHHLVVINEESEKAIAEGRTPIDNHALYKSQSKLDDVQTQFLFQTAESCMLEIKPIDDKINLIIKESRDKYSKNELKPNDSIPLPPEELQGLWKQIDETVLKYRDILQNTLGEENFQEFNKFATDKIAPNIERNIFKQEASKDLDNQLTPPIGSGCYGYSLYDVDSNNSAHILNMETGTVLYCNMIFSYDPGIQSFLYEDGGLISSLPRQFTTVYSDTWHYTGQFTGEVGKTYKIRGEHWVRSYQYYSGYGFHDPYGLNYFQGNHPTPYGFTTGQSGFWSHSIYKAASTEISYTIPRPPPHLDSIDMTGFPTGDNQTTYLRGTSLAGNTRSVQVSGSGVAARLNTSQSPTDGEILDIIFDVAQNAQRGQRQLTITVEGVVSNALTITVGDNSPQITGMTPPQANAGETVSVTISGNHFGVNPQIQILGTNVQSAISSATTTEITALFSVADAATAGQRGVRVKSFGYTGTGFQQVPGTSDTSNITDFTVTANPSVSIPEIGSIEKGTVKTFNVTISNAPDAYVTKFSFKDLPLPSYPRTKPVDGWKTGEGRFDDGSPDGLREVSFTGSGDKEIKIRGWERSSSKNNIKLEARFNNDTDVKKSREFTVSSVEFVEEADCTGYDNIEFERTRDYTRYLYVPKGGTNKIKAKIVPSGATGTFNLVANDPKYSISPNTVSNTSGEQLYTVSVANTAGGGNGSGFSVKANMDASTRNAEGLNLWVRERKEVSVVIHKVTEENDDVQSINSAETVEVVCVTSGNNMLLDTLPRGDDVEKTDPTGATTLKVITAGADSKCNTKPNSKNIDPPSIASVTAIQNHLNETWERQANVHFTVSSNVLSEAVNFDLDRDGKLKYPKTGQFQEVDKIDANKVANAYNVYYIGMNIDDSSTPGAIIAAVSNRSSIGSVRRTFVSPNGLEVNTVAHELGHVSGAANHTPLLPEYLLTLMYTYHTPTVTQCRVVDSDLSQIPNSNAF
jgi:hypothetical protein